MWWLKPTINQHDKCTRNITICLVNNEFLFWQWEEKNRCQFLTKTTPNILAPCDRSDLCVGKMCAVPRKELCCERHQTFVFCFEKRKTGTFESKPHQLERTKTRNDESKSWRIFGLTKIKSLRSQRWNACATTSKHLIKPQTIYSRIFVGNFCTLIGCVHTSLVQYTWDCPRLSLAAWTLVSNSNCCCLVGKSLRSLWFSALRRYRFWFSRTRISTVCLFSAKHL